MRTTVRLDDHLLREAKRVAHEKHTTLAAVIEDSLRESLSRRRAPAKRSALRLPTFKGGGGLQPGVDLDDSRALLDLMERGGPA